MRRSFCQHIISLDENCHDSFESKLFCYTRTPVSICFLVYFWYKEDIIIIKITKIFNIFCSVLPLRWTGGLASEI